MTRFRYYLKRDGNLNKAYEDYKKLTSNKLTINIFHYNNWLTEKYIEKPKPILDEIEHKYLENFLKPFRSRIITITKRCVGSDITKSFLVIDLKNEEPVYLPFFNAENMYIGMKCDETYTYEQLIEKNHL